MILLNLVLPPQTAKLDDHSPKKVFWHSFNQGYQTLFQNPNLLNVLLDLQYLNVATTGIKTYMVELAKAARKYPHPEVKWIFTHEPEQQAKDEKFKQPLSKLQRLNYHMDYFRWKEFQLPDLVKKHGVDVLICPDFVSPAASLPCRRLTVIHDAFFWQIPQNYPSWWRKYFINLIKKGLKEKTHIITTTEYSKKSLLEYLSPDWPITAIYQAPKGLKNATDPQFLVKNHLQSSEYFIHIGTFDRRKNIPLLVQAFGGYLQRTQSNKKLVLAGGPGQSKQMNDFPTVLKLVEKLGLQGKVLVTGYLKDSEIKALYEKAFAYVFPSENEGFGIPILEAMGFGVPVIHSNQPALLEVAGEAGLPFQTGSLEDLTQKLILLDQDDELRNSLIQKGKDRAGEFSAKKFIDGFYQLILNSKPTEK